MVGDSESDSHSDSPVPATNSTATRNKGKGRKLQHTAPIDLDDFDDLDGANEQIDIDVNVGDDDPESDQELSSYVINFEVEKGGSLKEFSLVNLSTYQAFLEEVAKALNVSTTHLGSIGYIPSFVKQSPKPLPKLIDDEASFRRMLLTIDNHVEEQKSKSKKGKSKAFSIRLCDRSEQGDGKKEKKKVYSIRLSMSICTDMRHATDVKS